MVFQVYQDVNLKKQVNALRKAGGRTAVIADHAESVMEKLALSSTSAPKRTPRRTKRGEARIKKCIKFDLVDGYRLLGIRKGQDLLFFYIGTHDECDRWIRNNKGLRSVQQRDDSEAVSVSTLFPEGQPQEEDPESDLLDDEYLTLDLDEKILRKVFRGLTGK